MIRKITAAQLRPGMYIHHLGCSWVNHPFLLNRFRLRSDDEVRKILDAGITEVMIDTDRGDDVTPGMRVEPKTVAPTPAADMVDAAPDARAARRLRRDQRTAAAKANVSTAAQAPATPATPLGETHAASREPSGPGPRFTAVPGTAPQPVVGPAPRNTAQEAMSIPAREPGAQATVPADSAEVGAPMKSSTRIADEFQQAKRVHAESCRVVRDLLTDVRLGKQVSIEQTHVVVEAMAESILCNPGPLLALCRLKQKDEYTFQHCVSVSALMMVFARAAELGDATIRDAGVGGLLHDIGKMSVPESVLNKPARLTQAELALMQMHVPAGLEILSKTPGVSRIALQIAAEHHERYDGSGYPSGLKGEAISRMGRMAAIVDVYDAVTSDRVYHRGMTPPEALKMLLARSDTHFETALVQLFIKTLGIYPTGSLVMLASGRLAIVVDQSGGNLLQPRVRVVYDTRKAAFVPPFDVDLARTAGHGGEDRILRHESPQKWSVDPVAYLLKEVA